MNPAILLYRWSNLLHRHGLVRTAWGFSWLNRFLFATWLPGSAQIGHSFVCGYWGLGIVIHKDAIIGDRCTICQNVTIGRAPDNPGVPVIGNDVYIGSGAVIVGDLKVGDGAKIGANSVVLRDVPAGVTVVGAPARPVSY